MGVYELKSNQQFLRYFDGGIVYVSELDAEAMNSFAVNRADWTNLTRVGTGLPDNALDVNGALISGPMLEKLAPDLGNSRLTLNCEGLCVLNTARVIDSSFNVEYYGLNDLFSWSPYGVQQGIETTWNRCDIKKGDVLVDFVAVEKETKELRKCVGEKEDKLIKMEAERERLCKQLASGQEEVEKKEEELKEEEESGALHQQVDIMEAELKSKKEELSKKEKELKNVEAAYKALQLQLSSTEAELQSVKGELEEKKRELKQLEQIRSIEKNLLEKEIKKKEKELEKAQGQSKTVREQHESTEAQLSIKKEELETKEKELKKVQEKSNEMLPKLAFSETELRLKKAQLEKLKEESKTKKEESDSLLQQLASAKAELKFAKEGLNLKEEELEKVEQEAKTFRDKFFNAEAELKVKMQELEKKGKELQEAKDQLSSNLCKEDQERKEKELQELQNQLSATQGKLKSKEEELAKTDKEFMEVNNQLSSTQAKLKSKEEELDLIGKALKAAEAASNSSIKLGPWGGQDGSLWSFHTVKGEKIKEITIGHAYIVDSLTFITKDARGHPRTWRFGGYGGGSSRIRIDPTREYIKAISGTHGKYRHGGGFLISSITFHTNLGTYGPYGTATDVDNNSCFSIPVEGAEVVGFHGRTVDNKYIKAVGVYANPGGTIV